MKTQQVLNCDFVSWYEKYKNQTIDSLILDVSDDFISYLKADGVVLPKGCEATQRTESWSEDDEDVSSEIPSFPELNAAIEKSITELGGAVFPKLNWSSPKDASWINFENSLRCTCAADIYLLLKSSEFISHDLCNPFEYCDDYPIHSGTKVKHCLILRKWIDIHPANEFRCFVKNCEIVGISQRHPRSYYSFIKSNTDNIICDVTKFFTTYMKKSFPDSDYVIDVVRESDENIFLLDINPWGPVTDSLLYSWEELNKWTTNLEIEQKIDFRCVDSEKTISGRPYDIYGVPKEAVDLMAQADVSSLMDFVKLQIESQKSETDSEDENT